MIQKYGWHMTSVCPLLDDKDEDQVIFSYTTGLYFSYNHPEVIVLGLDLDFSQDIITRIGSRVKGGEVFAQELEYEKIFDACKCVFRSVENSKYKEYLRYSQWFYEGETVPALQCLW